MSSKRTVWLVLALVASTGPALTACSSDVSGLGDGDDGADARRTEVDADASADATVQDAAPGTAKPADAGARDSGPDVTVVDADPEDASAADASADASDDASDDAVVDGSADASDEAGRDAAVLSDGGADAGAPCAVDQQIERRSCGFCGTESRICLAGGDDAGSAGPVWQPWGECRGQATGDACLPGTTRNVPCGRCGSQPQTCQANCAWATGFCDQPPTAVCEPASCDFVSGLSCQTGGRLRVCKTDCSYGDFGDCFDPTMRPDAGAGGAVAIALTAAPCAGMNKITVARTLPQATTLPRLNVAECPGVSISTAARSYDYVVVTNPDATRTATLSIWSHPAARSPKTIDSVMAVYLDRTEPPAPAERSACSIGVVDNCLTTAAGDTSACTADWAGLIDESTAGNADSRVTLAPGKSALVYVAGYGSTDHGDYQLSVRTDRLQ